MKGECNTLRSMKVHNELFPRIRWKSRKKLQHIQEAAAALNLSLEIIVTMIEILTFRQAYWCHVGFMLLTSISKHHNSVVARHSVTIEHIDTCLLMPGSSPECSLENWTGPIPFPPLQSHLFKAVVRTRLVMQWMLTALVEVLQTYHQYLGT